MTQKPRKAPSKQPPDWPAAVPVDPEKLTPVAADPPFPPPWHWPPYDPAPPWWDALEGVDRVAVAAAHLAYQRRVLEAQLAYIDKMMELLK